MKLKPLLTLPLFLCLGFGLGWWWRGEIAAPAAPQPSPSARDSFLSADTARPPAPPAVAPQAAVPASPPAGENRSTPSVPPPDLAPEPEVEDIPGSFRKLLDSGRFNEAMQVYSRVDRRDPAQAAELEGIVIGYLQRFLRQGEDRALTGLIDAFLAYDYDNLDVLLILARHHRQSGYPLEAARTFQLALAYAFEPGERQRVEKAFRQFLAAVDQELATEQRWQELAGFYENLALLDLQWPSFRVRLGEIYLEQDQPLLASRVLTPLIDHPTLGERASALLAKRNGSPEPPARTGSHATAVPLAVVGDHFHLPLQINRGSARLVIDTGASTTALSREAFDSLARRGGFTPLAPQMFNTANGPVRGEVYRADRVQLGQYQLRDVNVAVLDLQMPAGVDGLLGMNVLRNFRFELDQEQHLLYLQER